MQFFSMFLYTILRTSSTLNEIVNVSSDLEHCTIHTIRVVVHNNNMDTSIE